MKVVQLFITSSIFFLTLIFLSAKVNANDNFFNIENTTPEYSLDDGDKITILEYFDNNPPKIIFSDKVEGFSCTINKIKCSPWMAYPLTLQGSHSPKKFTIELVKGKIKKQTVIQLLPDDFSVFKVTGKSKLNSNIIFSRVLLDEKENILPASEIFNLKPNGDILFYKKLAFEAVDFRPHHIDGKLYYSYLRLETSLQNVTIIGKRVLLDDKLQQVKIFPELLDMHEFILLGLNWYISTRYTLAQTALGVNYINQELIEVKDGKEIYTWGIRDLYEQLFLPVGATPIPINGKNTIHQFHLNGIQILSDNELLISLAYDGVIIIDRPSKKIKMVIGGSNDQFNLTSEQKLDFIHTPNFDLQNQTLTVFHNNQNGKPFKVLEYSIDRALKKVNYFSVITSSKSISLKMGSVEKNGNIYSISNGYSRQAGPIFLEQTGKDVNMKITFKKLNAFVYRIYR